MSKRKKENKTEENRRKIFRITLVLVSVSILGNHNPEIIYNITGNGNYVGNEKSVTGAEIPVNIDIKRK